MKIESPPSKNFDQIVEGNINIKQLSKKKYKITIYKIGKFLRYQVWSGFSEPLNNDRSVYYQNAKQWIKNFSLLNESDIHFTPTTVMKIGNNKYLFVIDKARLNKKGHVVFKVSTKDIKLSEKKMLKIPCGDHDRVRFDIDGEKIPAMNSVTLGESLGLKNSWPCCSLFSISIDYGYKNWQSYPYYSTPIMIQGLGADGSAVSVGTGYLFVYMNFTNCDTNIGDDQGPAQIVTLSAVSQINFLNNPNNTIGTPLSQYIINSINSYNNLFPSTPPIAPITLSTPWSTVKGSLNKNYPKLIIDEELIFINPTPLTFTTSLLSFSLIGLPSVNGKSVVPIAVLITYLSSTISLSLINYNITNNNCNATLVTTDTQSSFNPYIIVNPGNSGGSFTFNATQPFFQNSTIIYLETSLPITVNITT